MFGVWGTGILVEMLLERGAEGDLVEAKEAIDRLAQLPATEGWVVREITLLRLRAASPGPRRRQCLLGLGQSLPRDSGIAWLRRAHSLGRGDEGNRGHAAEHNGLTK
jgi:hypothetical protein